MVENFTPINESLCVIIIKGRFFNYSLINKHVPTNDSEEEAKDQFYEQLERAYTAYTEKCAKMIKEKNAARERAIQNNTRGNKKAYKLARTKEKRLFIKKARQLDEEALIEIE
jgi:hypothetical protein